MNNLRQSAFAWIAGGAIMLGSLSVGSAQAPLKQSAQKPVARFSAATLEQLKTAVVKGLAVPSESGSKRSITGAEKPNAKATKSKRADRTLSGPVPGVKVDETYYDFQSNASMPERVAVTKVGGETYMNVVWMSADAEDWNDRGTSLTVLDAKDPANLSILSQVKGAGRIEPQRGGFPSIVEYPDGSVGVTSHTNYSAALTSIIYTRNTEVAGEDFTSTDVKPATSLEDNTLWARAARDDKNNIHVIYTYNAGPNNSEVGYVMSPDGGATWGEEKLLTGPNSFDGPAVSGFSADSYAIAAKGNTVVIIYSDNALGLHMRKSTDNGATWTNSLIFAPQYSSFTNLGEGSDGRIMFVTDTVQTPGSHMDVIIDNDGMANIVMAIMPTFLRGEANQIGEGTSFTDNLERVADLDTLFRSGFYLGLGMAYFKEGTQDLIPMAPPAGGTYNQNGTPISLRFGSGLSRLPQLGIDASNNLYCVYTSFKNDDTSDTRGATAPDGTFIGGLYGHIFATHKPATGNAWSEPVDLTPAGHDCLYGTLANNVTDGYLFYAYSADIYPGDRVTEVTNDPEFPIEKSEIYAASFPIAQLNPVGVNDQGIVDPFSSSVYPNPVSGVAQIGYTLPADGMVSLEIFNMMGQKVLSPEGGFKTAGRQSAVFNTTALPVGTYYYTLKHNGSSVTNMISVVR